MLLPYLIYSGSRTFDAGIPDDVRNVGKPSLALEDLRRAGIDTIATFAGVLKHELPGNPFDILGHLPPLVVYHLLTPVLMPGVSHPEDDRMMEFERKMLASGELSELALARKVCMTAFS